MRTELAKKLGLELGNKEYLFKVPVIPVTDWMEKHFAQPDLLLLYKALMTNYFATNEFIEIDTKCRVESCDKKATMHSAVCMEHHIENLQKFHMLPQEPSGRIFPPYC